MLRSSGSSITTMQLPTPDDAVSQTKVCETAQGPAVRPTCGVQRRISVDAQLARAGADSGAIGTHDPGRKKQRPQPPVYLEPPGS